MSDVEFVAKVVTANRLHDGAVVFRRPNGGWVVRVEEAVVAPDEPAALALLAAAEHDAAAALVVAPYLIEVDTATGTPLPIFYRERIRAFGPSRQFHVDVPSRHP
jgi:sulfite reductase (NADPH) hemoprotein beta-component